MGPFVLQHLFRAPNVEITCSASGKLTTSHFKYFVDRCLAPMIESDCLLLLDSWGGQKSDDCFTGLEEFGFECVRMVIPEGATATTQPLDVFYNRQWKGVARRFYDHVMVFCLNINLYQRNHIIKIHSLIHHQFSHDRFIPMGQYTFYAAGLRPDRPAQFETPASILFPKDLNICQKCPRTAFIRCVYCNTDLCFDCFFTKYHHHMPVDVEPVVVANVEQFVDELVSSW